MVEVTVPKWGLTMEEGRIVAWLRQVGETVTRDEILVEIETEKATGELPAPATGVVGEILVGVGETVPVGTPIARIYSAEEWAHR